MDRLAALIEEKLGVGGQGLSAKLIRGGRLLPRPVRLAGRLLVEAERMAVSPKLARQIDHAALAAACEKAERALGAIDPYDRRVGAALNWLAGNLFNILIVAALVVVVLIWRGLL